MKTRLQLTRVVVKRCSEKLLMLKFFESLANVLSKVAGCKHVTLVKIEFVEDNVHENI